MSPRVHYCLSESADEPGRCCHRPKGHDGHCSEFPLAEDAPVLYGTQIKMAEPWTPRRDVDFGGYGTDDRFRSEVFGRIEDLERELLKAQARIATLEYIIKTTGIFS